MSEREDAGRPGLARQGQTTHGRWSTVSNRSGGQTKGHCLGV